MVADYSAFPNMERGGWSDTARASGYVELFASASDQAINSLLDAASAKLNCKALDLCCGQGNVSEALLEPWLRGHWHRFFTSDAGVRTATSTKGGLH